MDLLSRRWLRWALVAACLATCLPGAAAATTAANVSRWTIGQWEVTRRGPTDCAALRLSPDGSSGIAVSRLGGATSLGFISARATIDTGRRTVPALILDDTSGGSLVTITISNLRGKGIYVTPLTRELRTAIADRTTLRLDFDMALSHASRAEPFAVDGLAAVLLALDRCAAPPPPAQTNGALPFVPLYCVDSAGSYNPVLRGDVRGLAAKMQQKLGLRPSLTRVGANDWLLEFRKDRETIAFDTTTYEGGLALLRMRVRFDDWRDDEAGSEMCGNVLLIVAGSTSP